MNDLVSVVLGALLGACLTYLWFVILQIIEELRK